MGTWIILIYKVGAIGGDKCKGDVLCGIELSIFECIEKRNNYFQSSL